MTSSLASKCRVVVVSRSRRVLVHLKTHYHWYVARKLSIFAHTQFSMLKASFYNIWYLQRVDCSGNPTFQMLLKRELAVFQGAEAHQDMPLVLILLRLGLISKDFSSKEESRASLFDIDFSWQKTPPGSRLPFEISSMLAGTAKIGDVADLRSLRLESCGNLQDMIGRKGKGEGSQRVRTTENGLLLCTSVFT